MPDPARVPAQRPDRQRISFVRSWQPLQIHSPKVRLAAALAPHTQHSWFGFHSGSPGSSGWDAACCLAYAAATASSRPASQAAYASGSVLALPRAR